MFSANQRYSVLIYIFYFLSGLTALVYEVVWARKLGLIFGVDAYGVATVLTVFFTGLGVGSWLFGRLVDLERPGLALIARRTVLGRLLEVFLRRLPMNADSALIGNNPRSSALLIYGLLELGIGFYAVLTPWIFKGIEQAQVYMWQQFSLSYGGFSIVTFFLSATGLILPTIFMGGTFPSAVAALSRINANDKRIIANVGTGSNAAMLYGLNTLGAVVGTLIAGFLLIWILGLNMTIYVSALVNVFIGLVALRI